jgi:hypothetical protein
LDIQKYDILRDTWIYQEIQQQVQAEERQRYLLEQRLILLDIVQVRFPRIKLLVKHVAEQLNEPVQLRSMLLKISTASTQKQAKQVLQEFAIADHSQTM